MEGMQNGKTQLEHDMDLSHNHIDNICNMYIHYICMCVFATHKQNLETIECGMTMSSTLYVCV